jgi:iron complex outermembrane receptor protein
MQRIAMPERDSHLAVCHRTLLLATTALCIAVMQAPSASAAPAIETVVVTAEKRAENLKDVPQSISVLNQKYINRIGADSLETFANTVPGLQMQTFAPGQTRITMRGISPDEQTGVTAVSYYLDEFPIAAGDQRSQPEVWLYDISQVEVLRGPQGTLWGGGAMGGMIRIVTNKPDTTQFEASALANVYSIDKGGNGYKADAMINAPIIDDMLAVRVVVENRFNAGWITDTINAIPDIFGVVPPPARYVPTQVLDNANSSHDTSVRAQVRFTPTNRLTIDGEFINDNIQAQTSSIGDVNAYTHLDLGLRPSRESSDLYNLTVNYAFDDFTVTSASSYSQRRTFRSLFQEPILVGSPFVTKFFETQTGYAKNFSEEVRVVSASDQPFRWTAGFFYLNSQTGGPTVATIDAPLFGLTDFTLFAFNSTSSYNTYAFFGRAEYDFTPNLTAIVGARFFHEGQTLGPPPGPHRDTSSWTPLVTLRDKFNDNWMAYATFSEGYRSGGFNAFAGPATYAPDKTKNYEIGAKYSSPDNRASLTADVFYIDWSDMQYTQLDAGGFFTFVGNASKASSRGVEFTGEYHWDNGFWGQLNADWTDAHLDAAVPLTIGFIGGTADAGTVLPAVPPYKFAVTAGYDTSIFGDYTLELTGVVSFVGAQQTKLEEGAIFEDPVFHNHYVIGTRLSPYSSGNLRATISKDNYSVALYVNNFWNDRSPIADDNFITITGQPLYYLQPRTFGLELQAHL